MDKKQIKSVWMLYTGRFSTCFSALKQRFIQLVNTNAARNQSGVPADNETFMETFVLRVCMCLIRLAGREREFLSDYLI